MKRAMDVSESYFQNHAEPVVGADEASEGAQVLDDLVAFVRRFVAMTFEQAAAVALWCAHSHALDSWEQSPLLAITSAEKRSGKTRLLDVLELLVARPWRVVMPSQAVVFRKIDADRPTLLLDETDAIFDSKVNETTEGLRALLNAGNRPRTMVPRCVGPSQALTNFKVFSAKALAGIRDLPDTVADRSIRIRLKRKAPNESVARFRRREVEAEAEVLYRNLSAWVERHAEVLTEARPQLPDELDDRAQDAWEPLLALADLAGGEWPEHARRAAVKLSGMSLSDESDGVRLLADIRAAFDARNIDRISSAELAAELQEIEEAPWPEWRGGKPISQTGIAKLLKHFEIRPRTVRFHDETTAKGYLRKQFADAFPRYLPSQAVTPTQPAPLSGKQAEPSRHTPEPETGRKPAPVEGCVGVTTDRGLQTEEARNGREPRTSQVPVFRPPELPDLPEDEVERLQAIYHERAGGDEA